MSCRCISRKYSDGLAWEWFTKADPTIIAIADRHYSRIKYGKQGTMVAPPGKSLSFLSKNHRDIWVSHYPKPDYALDGLDAYRCTMFRNESRAFVSSCLIQNAINFTEEIWGEHPEGRWITYVDTTEVRGTNPGYCFKRAGFVLDRNFKHRSLIRLVLQRA